MNTSETVTPDIEELGLVLHPEYGFLDPETGETFGTLTEGEFADLAAAQKTAMYVAYNDDAIKRLEEQKKALESQIKQRKARTEFFKVTYLDAFKKLAEGIMPKGKKSVAVGLLTVSCRALPEQITVKQNEDAPFTIAKIAPASTKITFDLTVPDLPTQAVKQLATLARTLKEAATVNVLVSKLTEDDKKLLVQEDAIEIRPKGEEKWDFK